jgi:molybdopterin-guanine dinucleotide biosynthesis protein B
MRMIGLSGWSGAGKTTLLTRVIPRFAERGITVSTVKHAHHAFDLDVPGKDSWRHREAGAQQVLISSAQRWALLTELRARPEPDLPAILALLAPVDLVIVEGFRSGAHAKIEVHRTGNGKSWRYGDDPTIRALASDLRPPGAKLPWAHLDDIDTIATIMLEMSVPI